MQFNARRIIKKVKSKDMSTREKRLAIFGIKSIKKLQDWNKKARLTLIKSKKFTNGLKNYLS